MKAKRHAKLIEIIQTHDIETQTELLTLLEKFGFVVTQATVSRDIRELKLTKTPTQTGGAKYTLSPVLDDKGIERLLRVFNDGLISMDNAANILVIRTFNGMAMAVGAAVDGMRHPELLGSVAGDDVVLCVAKTEADCITLMEKLKK